MKHLSILLICLITCFGCASARKTEFSKRQELGHYKWALTTFELIMSDYPGLLERCGYDRKTLPVPKFQYQKEVGGVDKQGREIVRVGQYVNGTIYYATYRVIFHETFHYISDYYQFEGVCMDEIGAQMLQRAAEQRLRDLHKPKGEK